MTRIKRSSNRSGFIAALREPCTVWLCMRFTLLKQHSCSPLFTHALGGGGLLLIERPGLRPYHHIDFYRDQRICVIYLVRSISSARAVLLCPTYLYTPQGPIQVSPEKCQSTYSSYVTRQLRLTPYAYARARNVARGSALFSQLFFQKKMET